MKKLFASILLQLFFVFNIYAQSIDYSVGAGLNHFNTILPLHIIAVPVKVTDEPCFQAGIGLEDLKIDSVNFPVRFTLNIINYNGSVYFTGFDTLNAHLSKYVLSLGIYPIDIKLLKRRLYISLGVESAISFFTHATGYYNTHHYDESINSTTYTHYNLNNGHAGVIGQFTFGLSGRVAYFIPLRNNWFIAPQFLYYQGVDVEFVGVAPNINSMRCVLAVGLAKRW